MRFGSAVAIALSLLSCSPDDAHSDLQATHLASFDWSVDAPWFGGFSGIVVNADGTLFQALSDRGFLVTGQLERSDGRIVGIEYSAPKKLRAGGNRALTGEHNDAEGLAIGPDGDVYISFEITHRVGKYHEIGQKAQILPDAAEFKRLYRNGSLEALAIDAQGHVFTMPEEPINRDENFPVFRWDGTQWTVPFELPRLGSFLAVGADFGPDGRLYLLERHFSILGFRTRVRSWDISLGQPTDEQTLLTTWPGTHDNLEGLAVWEDGDGNIRLTMISDDNFNVLQRTEIVEYVVRP